MKVEIVRDLDGIRPPTQWQKLVRRGEEYFVVSASVVPISGPEILVFPATSDGHITIYQEVMGGRGLSLEEILAGLEELDSTEPERVLAILAVRRRRRNDNGDAR